jgi:hypothetical protein
MIDTQVIQKQRQPYGSCRLPYASTCKSILTITKHDHLIHQIYVIMSLAISHHNIPCKNKLDVLYFVVACFTWLLWVSSKNDSYLRKTTMVICKLLFNLLKGPPLSNPIQLRWERQTPASHLYAIKLHVCRWNRSHVRGHVK